jgi:hypothetical protein
MPYLFVGNLNASGSTFLMDRLQVKLKLMLREKK